MTFIPRTARSPRWPGSIAGGALAVFSPAPVTARGHSVTSATSPEIAKYSGHTGPSRPRGDHGSGVASALPPEPQRGPPGKVR
jgi:hypothetical protein